MKYSLFLVIVLILFATIAEAESLMTFHLDQPIRLEADEMRGSYQDEHFEAFGAATLRQENLTLHADSIWFDKGRNEAGATGKVSLVEKSGTLVGDNLLLNFTSGQARLSPAKAHLSEQGFNLSGQAIERLDENNYRVTAGNFTACSADPPAWKFGASRVDVEVGGYARAKNMIFYLADVPVLYLPYFLYPVKTERESGLLIPHFGLSNRRGVELSLSYYQVLGRNQDATINLDSYSRAGIGKGVEYRYIFGEEKSGEALLYHVTGFAQQKDVYAGRWQHSGLLPGSVTLRSDLEYVSDRSYLQNFASEAKDYNRELVESSLYLARAWQKTDLSLQGEYVSNLSSATVETPLSRLPEIHLALLPQRLAKTPLYLRLDAQANRLQQESVSIGETFLFRPAARLALAPLAGISLDLDGGYRTFLARAGESDESAGFFDFSARLGTRLQRIYGSKDGISSRRHDLEPAVSYLHIGDGSQSRILGLIPKLTELLPENSFLAGDRMIFSLTNRLTEKRTGSEGEVVFNEELWLRLSSGYDLNPVAGEAAALLPLRGEIRVQAAKWLTWHADSSFSLTRGEEGWKSIMNGVILKDQRQDEVVIDYYYREGDLANYLSGRLQAPLTAQTRLAYEARYSVDDRSFLENRVDLEYRGQCWSVVLTFRDRPGNQEYLVNFNLAGLSNAGNRP